MGSQCETVSSGRPQAVDPRQSVAAWFVELERAIRRSDFKAAADAQAELRRLGVAIKFVKPEVATTAER